MLTLLKKIIKKFVGVPDNKLFNVKDLEILGKKISVICRSGTLDPVILDSIFEEYNIKSLITELQGKQAIILDIGGHIGGFSLMMAALLEQSHVYVYEAVPQNYQLIRANVLLNDLEKRVTPELKVVAETSDSPIVIRPFTNYKDDFNTGSLCVAYPSHQSSDVDGKLIPSVSIVDIVKRLDQIDVLKIDCEGSEYKILFSLGKEEFEKIGIITGELHDGKSLHQFMTNNHTWQASELLNYLSQFYEIMIHKTTKTSWGFLQTFTATKSLNQKT